MMSTILKTLHSVAVKGIILFFCCISFATAAENAPKRVALVIGNADYKQSLPKLANPANDAEDIAKALRRFGFEVIEEKDQTLEGMNRAIAEFGRKIPGTEAALFYYAGHGIQVKNQNYLIPTNALLESEASVPYQGVNLNQVLEEMDNGKSGVNIVIIDACRNNPLSGKFRSGQYRGLASPGATPKGTVIVYATDPGNVAADGSGRNGLFTNGLLKAFQGSDLSLDGVLTVASAEVEKASAYNQTPYVNGPKTLQRNFNFRVTIEPGPAAVENGFWTSIEKSTDVSDFESYIKKFPNGTYVSLAENSIRRLQRSAPAPAQSSTLNNTFDGSWSLWMLCDGTQSQGKGIKGYTRQLTFDVQQGRIQGASGQAGQPEYLALEGFIEPDGKAEIVGQGLTGNPSTTMGQVVPGTPYSLYIRGKLTQSSGIGERTTGRKCQVIFRKN